MNQIKKFIKRYYGQIIIIICICACIWRTLEINRPRVIPEVVKVSAYTPQHEKARKELIQEVDDYIKSVAPQSKVSGDAIVDGCLTYNVDIKFVLAQGLCESHFGTRGVAARTNSVFNVCAYDGRSATDMKRYRCPDLSIIPYLQLLRDRYLVNGKTEQDLLHNYVDKDGYRYATGKDYESFLRSTYESIEPKTDITKKCKIYKTLLARI